MEDPNKRYQREIAGRERWKNSTYARELLLTIEITHKCALRCGHCFAEASPENRDFIEPDIIERLAKDCVSLFQKYPRVSRGSEAYSPNAQPSTGTESHIRITGGDPFLHSDLYEIITSFSKRRSKLGGPCIDIETNGWWAIDELIARENITRLKEAGASGLSMTQDYWHSKDSPFNNDEYGERIEKTAKELNFPFRFITVALPNPEFIRKNENGELEFIPAVTPIGRARNLDEKYWGGWFFSKCKLSPGPNTANIGYVKTDELTIDPLGNVYLCNSGKCFKDATLSVGNLHEKRIAQILEEDSNPLVRILRERGLRPITEIVGISLEEHYQIEDRMSHCGLCHEMLRKYGKLITEKVSSNH